MRCFLIVCIWYGLMYILKLQQLTFLRHAQVISIYGSNILEVLALQLHSLVNVGGHVVYCFAADVVNSVLF